MYYTFFRILQVHPTQIAQTCTQKAKKLRNFTSFSPCFSSQVRPFCPTLSERWARGDSSLWPRGTVTELPSGKSLPESKTQNSPIQYPNSKLFGRILDRYVASLYVRPPTPQILDFCAVWILDFGFWILDFGFFDFGYWISDFGFWILERYVADLYVQILDFGFRILDFRTNFGFYIREEYCARRPGSADKGVTWPSFRAHVLNS